MATNKNRTGAKAHRSKSKLAVRILCLALAALTVLGAAALLIELWILA